MAHSLLDRLPPWYWDVPYVAEHFPGAVERERLRDGANCQLFAYEVLGLFGCKIPDLRSDELWGDTAVTAKASEALPLDLVLFNATPDPWGAHVAVAIGGEDLIHLCAEVGRPAVWTFAKFRSRERYRCLVGIKRPLDGRP